MSVSCVYAGRINQRTDLSFSFTFVRRSANHKCITKKLCNRRTSAGVPAPAPVSQLERRRPSSSAGAFSRAPQHDGCGNRKTSVSLPPFRRKRERERERERERKRESERERVREPIHTNRSSYVWLSDDPGAPYRLLVLARRRDAKAIDNVGRT